MIIENQIDIIILTENSHFGPRVLFSRDSCAVDGKQKWVTYNWRANIQSGLTHKSGVKTGRVA